MGPTSRLRLVYFTGMALAAAAVAAVAAVKDLVAVSVVWGILSIAAFFLALNIARRRRRPPPGL